MNSDLQTLVMKPSQKGAKENLFLKEQILSLKDRAPLNENGRVASS